MAEFRIDPLRGHTALVNDRRGHRPSEFSVTIDTASPSVCPFCPGHEQQTPPSSEQDRTQGWSWRLFPNLYPAVSEDAMTTMQGDGTCTSFPAFGYHEVLVETDEHHGRADEYATNRWLDVMCIWQRGLRRFYGDSRVRYVHIFRNQGYRAGATIAHPHQQLVALPFVPNQVSERIRRMGVWTSSGCEHCNWLKAELQTQKRVLEESREAVALACFAPRFPFEWQIVGRAHQRFDELDSDSLSSIAGMILSGLSAMRNAVNDPDFNLILFSTPPDIPDVKPTWAIDILPRIGTQAGFEWGTGVHIVSVPPEEAADLLADHWR